MIQIKNSNQSQQNIKISIISWLIVLFLTLIIYDTLLYSSLKKEMWNNAQSSAQLVSENTLLHINTGIRFGKKLTKFPYINEIINNAYSVSKMPIAVLDTTGNIISSSNNFSKLTNEIAINKIHDFTIHDTSQRKTLLFPINDINKNKIGLLAIQLNKDYFDIELFSVFKKQIFIQIGIAFIGFLLLFFILTLWKKNNTSITNFSNHSKQIRIICIFTFLLVMLTNGIFALNTISSRYTKTLEKDANIIGSLTTDTINRLLLVSLAFNDTNTITKYLTNITQMHNGKIALEIVNPEKMTIASSIDKNTKILANVQNFHLSTTEKNTINGQNWNLKISLVHSLWINKIQTTILDLITMVAISLIFMIELFLLLMRGIEFFQNKNSSIIDNKRVSIMQSSLLRPIVFFMMFAMDMTVSFIPLRMDELVPVENLSRTMLLGLPISAEMGMTGISVIFAGYWIKHQGAKFPFITGLSLIAIGYLGSMLSTSPWHFIIARGIVGTGYGLTLLTAQAATVKDGMLADMFAGVYAGSLCGSAMGAMLADHFGYATVFLISAFILLCLIPLPFILFKNIKNDKNNYVEEKYETAQTKITFKQICLLLNDKYLISFIFLNLIPFALISIGFLNYFLPIYLKDAGTTQSDIGRIYMLNCLIVIYSGPFFSKIVMKMKVKANMVCLVGIISALAVFSLSIFPPLPASILGSILLGLAMGLSIPAHSEYLLKLNIAQAIGVDQSMSLLDALQRVGQILGPLCVGIILVSMSINNAALSAGIVITIISFIFLALTRNSIKIK